MRIEEFESQYRRHAGAVILYARRCVGRPDVAEEIASEAFLELLRNIDKIDAGQLPAWLYTVVKHRAIDHWRRHNRETELVGDYQDGGTPAGIPFDWGVLESSGLKAVHRLCLTLRYTHGMSREEIAAFTGLRETQVKGHLRYGLELLRKTLAAERRGKRK